MFHISCLILVPYCCSSAGLEPDSRETQFHHTLCTGRWEVVLHTSTLQVQSVQVTAVFLYVIAQAWHNTQSTVAFLAAVECFLCFFLLFGTHDSIARFFWPANAERFLLHVGSFEFPNCWAHPLANNGFQYALHGREQRDFPTSCSLNVIWVIYPQHFYRSMNSEWLGPTIGVFLPPSYRSSQLRSVSFAGIVLDDLRLHSFPTFLKLLSQGKLILERTNGTRLSFEHTTFTFPCTSSRTMSLKAEVPRIWSSTGSLLTLSRVEAIHQPALCLSAQSCVSTK